MLRIELVCDERALKLMAAAVQQLTRIGDHVMALKDELAALVTALNNATNGIAAEIAKLKQQIADLLANPNSITEADKAEVEAGLQAQIDRLTALGQDPGNPVPTP